MLHRYRESLVHDRTALANRTRGYLREFGLFIPVGLSQVRKQVPLFLEDAENELSNMGRELFNDLLVQFYASDDKVTEYDSRIEKLCKQTRLVSA